MLTEGIILPVPEKYSRNPWGGPIFTGLAFLPGISYTNKTVKKKGGRAMRIGTVEIHSKLALAPMAGVTDAAFRQICAELGAGYTITELISSKALCYHDKKTFSLLTQFPGEHPAAVQIFGSDPACMAEAAQIAIEHTGADILDINMGCPMGKIVNNGDGAALMRDPDKASWRRW